LLGASIVLVWDRLGTHVSAAMKQMITARAWLTVFLLPAYAPELKGDGGRMVTVQLRLKRWDDFWRMSRVSWNFGWRPQS